MNAGFLSPLLDSSPIARSLVIERTGTPLAVSLEAAFDSATRRRGLLGRTGLDEGAALIIAPSNSIHTFFMRFPIDVVFADRDGRVVKIRPAMAAWRLTAAPRGFAAIELRSGSASRAGLVVGDRLRIA
jgi:uncharacterized membrane protein (UPF0127 family)